MTESWHRAVKYKINNMQHKYTLHRDWCSFAPGGILERDQVLSHFSTSGREPRGSSSWNTVKVSDICPLLNLDAAQVLGVSFLLRSHIMCGWHVGKFLIVGEPQAGRRVLAPSWRKALADVAFVRTTGQAGAGSSSHCTVWAKEMRL